MKSKIIFVILPHLGGGGAERSSLNLLNNWATRNKKIYLILLKKEGVLLELLDKKIEVLNLNSKRILSSLVPIYKLIRLYKPDTILTLMWPLTSIVSIAWLMSFKTGKLFLADHNPLIDSWLNDINVNKYFFKILYNLTYLPSSGIICVSRQLKNDILKTLIFNKKNIYYINNPVSSFKKDIYDYKILREKYYGNFKYAFLSVGRLKKSRDLMTVLKSLSEFKFIKQTKLIVLGDGPEKESLINFINDNNLKENVEFRGFEKDTYKFYYISDLYIHSSLYDAMPLTLIEALTCESKILSTNCKYGPSEILDKGKLGMMINVSNVEEMKSGFLKALNYNIDENYRKKKIKEFAIEAIAQKYLNIF